VPLISPRLASEAIPWAGPDYLTISVTVVEAVEYPLSPWTVIW
jgi:hypothetical protein